MIQEIPLDEILSDDEFNCRGAFAAHEVLDLVRSIEANGLLEPILVQPWSLKDNPDIRYRLVAGYRRYKAHQVLGKATIACLVKEGLSELEARKLNLEENKNRKNLNILQEAKAILPFFVAGWKKEQVAREMGESNAWVTVRFALLTLPEEIQKEAAAGFLTQDHIKQLVTIKTPEKQYEAVRRIKDARLRGERVSRVVKKKSNPFVKRARQAREIFEMQSLIQDAIQGNNFGTRCLAWAAGEISDAELYGDIKEVAPDWSPPLPQEVEA